MPYGDTYDFVATGKYNVAFGVPECMMKQAKELLVAYRSSIRISIGHINENYRKKRGTIHQHNNHGITSENALSIAKLAIDGKLDYRIVEIEIRDYRVTKALIRVRVKRKNGEDTDVVMPIQVRRDRDNIDLIDCLNINTVWINDDIDNHDSINPRGIVKYKGNM